MPHVDNKVLVYHYRANGAPVVRNGIAAIPESELHDILTTNPNLKKTVKALPHRGARHVDIHQRDLLPQPASSSSGDADNADQNHGTEESNVAGVKLPFRIWLEGLATGGYESIVVLSEGFGVSRGKGEEKDRDAGVEATGTVGEGKGKGKGKGKVAKVDEKVKEKAEVRTKLGSLDVGEGGWKA